MDRRGFLKTALVAGGALTLTSQVSAQAAEVCQPSLDFVSAEATYFARYQHFHLLSIPVSILVNPPVEGFKVRTSNLDQGSLDEAAFMQFIKETGLSEAGLRHHSHEVNFTQDQLKRIGAGEKEVEIIVPTPKGNLAHRFYFTATKSALIKVQRGHV